MLRRVWAVWSVFCCSVQPNEVRGNALFALWGLVFLGINRVRLYELGFAVVCYKKLPITQALCLRLKSDNQTKTSLGSSQ